MTYRSTALLFIKYGPAVMSLTCSLKVMLLFHNGTYDYVPVEYAVKYINVVLNVIVVIGLYCLGKVFNFCWKHRSLCRTALWGYFAYTMFLVHHVNKDIVYPFTVAYVILVLLMLITYKKL